MNKLSNGLLINPAKTAIAIVVLYDDESFDYYTNDDTGGVESMIRDTDMTNDDCGDNGDAEYGTVAFIDVR